LEIKMTRKIMLSTVAFVASAGIAAAGGVAETAAPAVVTPAAPMVSGAFDGFYAGLSYGTVSGQVVDTPPPGGQLTLLDDGTAFGGVAGYNVQNGAFVLGGELRYLHLNGFENILAGFGVAASFDSVTDIRGRAGYAMGNFMVYGALGYSWSNYGNLAGDVDVDGVNYGLGVEFNVTDSIFVGADYTWRDLDGFDAPVTSEVDLDTFTLTGGIRF
jgi:outer membrane immunogenic protein